MKRVNGIKDSYCWEDVSVLPDGAKLVGKGGFFLDNGKDLRQFFADPE